LQLSAYWVEELQVKARPEILERRSPFEELLPKVNCEVLQALENERVYKVNLRVVAGPKAAAGALPYEYRLKMSGVFSFPVDTPVKVQEQLINVSGPAMLYGLARGVIAQATALGPQGAYLLPSLNFVDIVESKAGKD
jgi:Preprotein translocase subunit SecB.